MLFKHINGPATLAVQQTVAKISASLYSGNLTVDARALPAGKKGNACRFTLRVRDAYAKPARRSASGRRLVSANWQAHKEVMEALFDLYPDAVLVTALTTYTGRDDFRRRFAETYNHNVGSAANPVAFGSL